MRVTLPSKPLALVFAGSVLLGICVQAAAPREDDDEATFTTIDFPGALGTAALDINATGQIVGLYVSAANLSNHGFLRSKTGEFTPIDFPGSDFTRAAGINNRGDIVGWYRLASEPRAVRHGYLLRGGTFTTIDPPDALWTNALGINARGDIVGRYCTVVPCSSGSKDVHGFLLSTGEFTTIDVPDAAGTSAWKSNRRGQILGGYQDTEGKFHVYLLSEGEFTTIDFPGAFDTASGADNGGINARGDIVSFYCDAAPCTVAHGFLLSRGEFTSIDVPDALGTAAFGINPRGDIVGAYLADTSGNTRGFLLSRQERVEDKNLTPRTLGPHRLAP